MAFARPNVTSTDMLPTMELVEPTSEPRHSWLDWLGLQEPPPEPDTWVPVARAFEVDELETSSSSVAARLVEALRAAGIQASQRSYAFDTSVVPGALAGAPFSTVGGGMETRVAVLVHNRDRAQAAKIAAEFQRVANEPLISDEELTRRALEAGPPPEA
jgi:hypothetical protein